MVGWWHSRRHKTGIDRRYQTDNERKNVVTREVPDKDDNDTLPSLQTKVDDVEEGGNGIMNELLNAPPSVRRTILNDESTISSNITMYTHTETVESNIGNVDNSVNLMAHMLQIIMQEIKQGSNLAPAKFQSNTQEKGGKYYHR